MVEFIICSRSNGVVVVVVLYGTTAQRWALASCFSGFEKCNVNLFAQSLVWKTKSMYLWPLETYVAQDLGSATSRTHNDCGPLKEAEVAKVK
jgi:hypothetical protein